jgi:Transposase/Transposase IS116/IS110/IS902 family
MAVGSSAVLGHKNVITQNKLRKSKCSKTKSSKSGSLLQTGASLQPNELSALSPRNRKSEILLRDITSKITCGLTIQYRLSEVVHRLPAGPQESPAGQTVNNFAAAGSALVLDGFYWYPVHWFPAPGGSGLLTASRSNDFQLYGPPAGRGLTLNDYSRGRCLDHRTTLLYCRRQVKPAGTEKNTTHYTIMNTAHPACPYDLVIGLDRSDKKADLCLITTATGQCQHLVIDTAPEALWEWLARLRQQFPQAHVGLCLEQPAVHLISFLEAYPWITLHPINPLTLQKYREAFVTSRAKDDTKDADYLADLLFNHQSKLPVWAPEDSPTRTLQQLVFHRRAVVNERTALTNRLIALLKQYFPQALSLCGEDLWRPLATSFLLKWPSLQTLQQARSATVKAFYYLHGSRSQSLIQQRLALLAKAVPVTDETGIIDSFARRVQLICRQLQLTQKAIAGFDQQIAAAYKVHPDHALFASLPGAGPVLGVRLLTSLGSQRERFGNQAAQLQRYTGIAPVTKRSGGSCYIHRRYLCPKFHRQSFHEYAGESILWSRWAAAYYLQQRRKGCSHHTAVRALAFKWQRIIWRCWQNRQPYDEALYEAALKKHGSPIVPLFDSVVLGKSPWKHPVQKQLKIVDGLPQR